MEGFYVTLAEALGASVNWREDPLLGSTMLVAPRPVAITPVSAEPLSKNVVPSDLKNVRLYLRESESLRLETIRKESLNVGLKFDTFTPGIVVIPIEELLAVELDGFWIDQTESAITNPSANSFVRLTFWGPIKSPSFTNWPPSFWFFTTNSSQAADEITKLASEARFAPPVHFAKTLYSEVERRLVNST